MLIGNKVATRLVKWTCPLCFAVETEEVDISDRCIKPPHLVESIPLVCEECTRRKLDLPVNGKVQVPARQKLTEAEGRKIFNRVFDGRDVAPGGP